MPYIAALDGLRAVAVLVVMCFHAKVPFLAGGYLGVDIFFVLSGFLITVLLREELFRSGSVNLRRFYLNRAGRLLPPLLLLLIIYIVLAPVTWPRYHNHMSDVGLALAYLTDYSISLWREPRYLAHTWSLSVEVHFYLLWPLFILAIHALPVKRLLVILIVLYFFATVWRVFGLTELPWRVAYYRFDLRVSGFVLGAVVAVIWKETWRVRGSKIFCGSMICMVLIFSKWGVPLSLQAGGFFMEILVAWLLLLILRAARRDALLSSPIFLYLGRMSYGMYLFHYPIMLYLRKYESWAISLLVGGILAILIAAFSYHFIECWIRRWRKARLH